MVDMNAGCFAGDTADYVPFQETPSQNSFGIQPPTMARVDARQFKIPAFSPALF